MNDRGVPHVTILMAVYNGADHLAEQLQSLAAQTHRNWHLIASDDGSTDDSREILSAFANEGHAVTILDGPKKGHSAANFLSLITHMPRVVPGHSWVAFCDQDDVWMPNRLSAGLAALADVDRNIPALFCARQMITDAHLTPRRVSISRPYPPDFRNALVQNIASGNTSLLNPAGALLLREAAQEAREVVMHDWWIYQMITGVGGHFVHHDEPLIFYRQHENNTMGVIHSRQARANRLSMVIKGGYRKWMDTNIDALSRSSHRFTPANRALLADFAAMRRTRLPLRLWRFARLGIYRQRRLGTAVMWLSVLLGRL